MWKYFVIFVMIFGAALGIPKTRALIMPHLTPIFDRLGPVGDRVSKPAKRWAARNEVGVLTRKLAEDFADHKELPTALEFPRWIKRNVKGGKGGLDPWGLPYYLVRSEHQITVGSGGPDRQRGSTDDIRISVPIS
jgi:hypothetical protein